MISNFLQFITEHKFWGKSNREFLDWIKSIESKTFIVLDTETTGLDGPKLEQLTQVSGIAFNFSFSGFNFEEVSDFNKKIKLTPQSKKRATEPNSRIKWVLSFNHYGSKDKSVKYFEEEDILNQFFDWVDGFEDPILVIQNAEFDAKMLSVRANKKIKYPILDTKQVIQLFYLPTLQKLAETDTKYKQAIEKIGTADRDYGLISSSMSKVGPQLGLDMTNYHDALTDCRITTQMLQKILVFLEEHKDVDISKYQAERIQKIREH